MDISQCKDSFDGTRNTIYVTIKSMNIIQTVPVFPQRYFFFTSALIVSNDVSAILKTGPLDFPSVNEWIVNRQTFIDHVILPYSGPRAYLTLLSETDSLIIVETTEQFLISKMSRHTAALCPKSVNFAVVHEYILSSTLPSWHFPFRQRKSLMMSQERW